MLHGIDLGKAIEIARLRKNVSKKQMAADFNVTGPAVQDWIKRGTIGKDRLVQLWLYFADVCPPTHWGIQEVCPHWPDIGSRPDEGPAPHYYIDVWPFPMVKREEIAELSGDERGYVQTRMLDALNDIRQMRAKQSPHEAA